jgi:hypothetical protein
MSALTSGYSPKRILDYLKKVDPDLALKINTAVHAGYPVEQILKYIGKNGKQVSKLLQSNQEAPRNIYQEARKGVPKTLKNAGAFVGLMAAGGLGAYALSRAVPQAAQALQGELMGSIPKPPPQGLQLGAQEAEKLIGFEPLQISNQQQQFPGPQQPSPQTEIPPVQPQQMAPEQPPISPIQVTPTPQIAAPKQTIAPLPGKVQSVLNGMLQSKKQQTPEEMAIALKNLYPKEVKEYEKTTKTPLVRAVEELSKQVPKEPEISKPSMPIDRKPLAEVPSAEIKKELQPEIESPKKEISKGSTVGLPNGEIGEIKDVRQGIATVEYNGKEYRRKIEDLIEPPMPMKDLATLHEELIKGIEEKTGEEVSRMANWVGYDEGKKSLAFQPHGPNSKFYVYDDITEEEADELKSIEAMRKTSGENYIGAWKQGTKSIVGNRLFNLIRKIQMARGGKGKEYSYRFDSIYDALEPAKKASKEKHEREQDEKRKTKKPTAH